MVEQACVALGIVEAFDAGRELYCVAVVYLLSELGVKGSVADSKSTQVLNCIRKNHGKFHWHKNPMDIQIIGEFSVYFIYSFPPKYL
jgi:hypothetical protein